MNFGALECQFKLMLRVMHTPIRGVMCNFYTAVHLATGAAADTQRGQAF
jgi:hypothetical protein